MQAPVAALVGNEPKIVPVSVSNVTPPLKNIRRLSRSFGDEGNVTVSEAISEPTPIITFPTPVVIVALPLIDCCPSGLSIIVNFV
jgi:hypothetical protein